MSPTVGTCLVSLGGPVTTVPKRVCQVTPSILGDSLKQLIYGKSVLQITLTKILYKPLKYLIDKKIVGGTDGVGSQGLKIESFLFRHKY